MKSFTGEDGRKWTATALEEETPRHHGRWYMAIRPAGAEEGGGSQPPAEALALPEIRWKNRHTAERTLTTMSDFELRRRLRIALKRHSTPGMERDAFGDWKAEAPGAKGGTEAS